MKGQGGRTYARLAKSIHVRWECKYHIVIIPKYRKRDAVWEGEEAVGEVIKEVCRQRGIELVEGHLMRPHPHVRKHTAQA